MVSIEDDLMKNPTEEGPDNVTYYKTSDGIVTLIQHPKCPGCEPSVVFAGRLWKDLILQELTQNRPVISFVDTCDGDGELEVL